MTPLESEGQAPSRKRSRRSASSEDAGSKKSRGRPRVDTQDETATDRRRTQIRLAQRAYRQRKETTISSLKKDVTKLQSSVEEMNRSFLRFNDLIINSGVLKPRPDLAQELRTVTETFVNLAKAASTTDEAADGEEEVEETSLNLSSMEPRRASAATRTERESRTLPPPYSASMSQSIDVGWGYSTRYSPSPQDPSPEDVISSTSYLTPMTAAPVISTNRTRPLTIGQVIDQSSTELDASNSSEQTLPFGLIDMLSRGVSPNSIQPQTTQSHFATLPSPRITTPPLARTPSPSEAFSSTLNSMVVQAPYTYSFQESTFARRLTRASLERGFRLLSSASSRPAAVNHVFKLSLPFISIDQMLTRFKDLLTKGTRDSLDCWTAPFIHLGGAGTHYPQKDESGNLIPPPNSWSVRSIGPQKKVRLDNTREPNLHQEVELDLRGFEGEWFDSQDVAGYLEEKGVHIEGQASFAEAYIEVDDQPNCRMDSSLMYTSHINMELDLGSTQGQRNESPDSVSSASEPQTPSNGVSTVEQIFNSNPPFGLDMGGTFNEFTDINRINASGMFEQPLALDLVGFSDNNMFSNMGSYSALDMMGTDMEPQVVKQKQKRLFIVDVQKLIEGITKRGVCLGRSPGFRRKDVDLAFRASLLHAY